LRENQLDFDGSRNHTQSSAGDIAGDTEAYL